MYVLYLARCTEQINEDSVVTTIHHDNPPSSAKWCVVTYRNNERYTATRVDCFATREDAAQYMRSVEPEVPLVSMGGRPMSPLLSHDGFLKWKELNRFEEYDYRKMYPPGGKNLQESLMRAK
jgi:hypothetical protein